MQQSVGAAISAFTTALDTYHTTGSVATDIYEGSKNANAGKLTFEKVARSAGHAVLSATIGFGSSLISSGVGRSVTGDLETKGTTMLLSTKGTANWTRAQARNLAKQGKILVNAACGISSVVGTMFTWPTATALSMTV